MAIEFLILCLWSNANGLFMVTETFSDLRNKLKTLSAAYFNFYSF